MHKFNLLDDETGPTVVSCQLGNEKLCLFSVPPTGDSTNRSCSGSCQHLLFPVGVGGVTLGLRSIFGEI